ncbi:MAG: hypothetical protein WC156_06540 [Pedobacter sp.]
MKLLLLLPLLMLSFGCAQNHFNVPTENFADKVKVLGVAPIFVDADSDIKFPRKDQLISLMADMNRKYEQQFVRKLKATGNFYTVVLLDGDPQLIFSSLFFRREKRDDATIQYNKYFWKIGEIQDYIRKNNLDAAMLVTVSGISKTDKVFSNNLLKSMSSDYNYLIMTAQILDANGTVLWEYPNFRSRILTYYPMINLQYPDFSEAEANLSAAANIKFKSIDGIRLILEQKRKDLLLRETQESVVYGKQFDEILSFIKYAPNGGKKEAAAPVEPAKPNQAEKPYLPVQEPVKEPVKEPEIPEQPVVAPLEDSIPAK